MSNFLDTNVLIYGLVPTPDDPVSTAKGLKAVRLIDELLAAGDLVISAQVMSEFFVVSTTKGKRPLTPAAASLVLERLSQLYVVAVDSELVFRAAIRKIKSQISYWDALIVEAALRAGAATLYTEDLQHGMRFDTLQVINPFLEVTQ